MTKYIVKNCPSCMKDTACFSTGTFNKSFQLCMNYPGKPDNSLSNKILQTLQVQEVE